VSEPIQEGSAGESTLLALTYAALGAYPCQTFWGSHRCDRPPGHELPHVCGTPEEDDGLCSMHDGVGVRHLLAHGLSPNRWMGRWQGEPAHRQRVGPTPSEGAE